MPFEIISPGTRIDFVGKARLCAVLSTLMIVASLVSLLPSVRGMRLGIDFAGGTEIQLRFAEGVVTNEGVLRQIVGGTGIEGASVVRYGGGDTEEYLIRFPGEPGEKGEAVDVLVEAVGADVGAVEVERVEFVGPRVGAELRRDGLTALAVATLLILIYITIRFSARFAPGAVIALVHDIVITGGIFVILGLEFDLRVLAALLAILGYSLNDTIIVYDRIRENMEIHTKFDLPDVLNRSVNQTLSRTLLTSGTTLVAVLALLVLGGEVIRPFALAMVIGIGVGTYSSVFIAAPTLLLLESRLGTPATTRPDRGREASPPSRSRNQTRRQRAQSN